MKNIKDFKCRLCSLELKFIDDPQINHPYSYAQCYDDIYTKDLNHYYCSIKRDMVCQDLAYYAHENIKIYNKETIYIIYNDYYQEILRGQYIGIRSNGKNIIEIEFSDNFPFDFDNINPSEFLDRIETMKLFQ